MWTQVRRLEHAVFLRDDKSMKEMLRKHSVQSPPGTLRLFCWGFVCICSLRSPPLKKNPTEKTQHACFHFRSSKWGMYEDRARSRGPYSLHPCSPNPTGPETLRLIRHLRWVGRGCALVENPPWVTVMPSLTPCSFWNITVLIHTVKHSASVLKEACS